MLWRCSTNLILLLIVVSPFLRGIEGVWTPDTLSPSVITSWGNRISTLFDHLQSSTLCVDNIQNLMNNRIGSLAYNDSEGNTTLGLIQNGLETLLDKRLYQAQKTLEAIETAVQNGDWENKNWSHLLQDVYSTNLQLDSTIQFQYFGTPQKLYEFNRTTGFIEVSTPSTPNDLLPWYILAASGPKNIVILLDASRSMSYNSHLKLAINAAVTIINGLSIQDHFNVILMQTNDEVFGLGDTNNGICWQGTLARATPQNRQAMIDLLFDIPTRGSSIFAPSVYSAFNILANFSSQTTTSAQNIIIALTDSLSGNPTSDQHPKVQPVEARLLVYSFGPDLDHETSQTFACTYDGVLTVVGNDRNKIDQIPRYYQYSSTQIVGGNGAPSWTGPHNGVISIGFPVYDKSVTPPNLVGVVGVDILVQEFQAVTLTKAKPGLLYSFLVNNYGDVIVHPSVIIENATTVQDISTLEPLIGTGSTNTNNKNTNINTQYSAQAPPSTQNECQASPSLTSVRDDLVFGNSGVASTSLPSTKFQCGGASDLLFHHYYYPSPYADLQEAVYHYTGVSSTNYGLTPFSVAVVVLSPRGYYSWIDSYTPVTESNYTSGVLLSAIGYSDPYQHLFEQKSSPLRAGVENDILVSFKMKSQCSEWDSSPLMPSKYYIGTQLGVYKAFPSTDLFSEWASPMQWDWYRESVIFGTSQVLTACVTQKSNNEKSITASRVLREGDDLNLVGGVIASDMPYSQFQNAFLNATNCQGPLSSLDCIPCSLDYSTPVRCFLFSSSGTLITHSILSTAYPLSSLTLANDEPGLTSALKSMGVLNADLTVNTSFFPSNTSGVYSGTVQVTDWSNSCSTLGPFYVSNVLKTNMYLVAFYGYLRTKVCQGYDGTSDSSSDEGTCEVYAPNLYLRPLPTRLGRSPPNFLESVRTYKCVPDPLSPTLGILVPFCVVGLGVLILVITRRVKKKRQNRLRTLQLAELGVVTSRTDWPPRNVNMNDMNNINDMNSNNIENYGIDLDVIHRSNDMNNSNSNNSNTFNNFSNIPNMHNIHNSAMNNVDDEGDNDTIIALSIGIGIGGSRLNNRGDNDRSIVNLD